MPNSLAKVFPDGSTLTEWWAPSPSLYMGGQKTDLDTANYGLFTFEDQPGFPGGKCLQAINTGANIQTPASALVEAMAQTDFFALYWVWMTAGNTSGIFFGAGEGANNGFDAGFYTNGPSFQKDGYFEIPGGDGSYPFVQTTGDVFAPSMPSMIAMWYTVADATLRLSVNAGTVFPLVNTVGVGDPDPTNTVFFGIFSSDIGEIAQMGPGGIWQGTQAVANGVNQLEPLFLNKWQYSDFDTGDDVAPGGGSGRRQYTMSRVILPQKRLNAAMVGNSRRGRTI